MEHRLHQPRSGLRRGNIAKSNQLFAILSAGTPLCPQGIACCRVYGRFNPNRGISDPDSTSLFKERWKVRLNRCLAPPNRYRASLARIQKSGSQSGPEIRHLIWRTPLSFGRCTSTNRWTTKVDIPRENRLLRRVEDLPLRTQPLSRSPLQEYLGCKNPHLALSHADKSQLALRKSLLRPFLVQS